MATDHDGVSIGTISGGIVNFGGAVYISPISISRSNSGSGENNTELVPSENTQQNGSAIQTDVSEIIKLIQTMLK